MESNSVVGVAEPLGYVWAIVLGLIQGLTEFLPVSSSGHLALAESFYNGQPENVAFDLLLHLATVGVVVGAFWKDLLEYWRKDRIILGYIGVGTVPAVAVGLLFSSEFEALRESPTAVCCALMVSGLALVACEKLGTDSVLLRRLGVRASLVVGLCQSLAITPGISRSGMTITGGVLCGLKREDAVKFSFLMMVPAVMGATCYKALKHPEDFAALNVGPTVAGVVVAAISGYVALRILLRLVREKRLMYFAAYCALAGICGLVYFNLIRA